MTQQDPSPEQIEHEISATRAEIDETLDALHNKLSPGELLDQALSYAKDSGGEFAANFGRTVRDNPLPVALLGIGLGWLMMSGRSKPADDWREPEYDHGRRSGDPLEGAYSTAGVPGAGPSGQAQEASGRYGSASAAGTAGERTSTAKTTGKATKAGDDSDSVMGRVGDKASDLAAGAKAHIDDAGDRMGEVRDEVGERVTSARRKTGEYAGRARRRISQAKDSAGRYYHENPLVVGALALSAGAALGALLPSTKHEDEVLGEHSDAVKSKAQDTLAEGVEKAKNVAATAAERGKEEAKRQRGSSTGGKAPSEPSKSASSGATQSGGGDRMTAGPGQNPRTGTAADSSLDRSAPAEGAASTQPKRRQSQ